MANAAQCLALLAAASLLPAISSATTCTVSGWEFYQNASKVGWEFRCQGRGMLQPNGMLRPQPSGEVVCTGTMGWLEGHQELWIAKPSWLVTAGWEIRRGWEFEQFETLPDASEQRMSPTGRDLIVSAQFAAGQAFTVGIGRVRLRKNAGDCGRLWSEAF